MQSVEPVTIKDLQEGEDIIYPYKGIIKVISKSRVIRRFKFESRHQCLYQLNYAIKLYKPDNRTKYLTLIFDEP